MKLQTLQGRYPWIKLNGGFLLRNDEPQFWNFGIKINVGENRNCDQQMLFLNTQIYQNSEMSVCL